MSTRFCQYIAPFEHGLKFKKLNCFLNTTQRKKGRLVLCRAGFVISDDWYHVVWYSLLIVLDKLYRKTNSMHKTKNFKQLTISNIKRLQLSINGPVFVS